MNLTAFINTAAILFLTLGFPVISNAQTILTGAVTHVRDVDTIEIRGQAVRLNGVDGPELGKQGGDQAKIFMRNLVLHREVTCELNGQRNGDRLIGVCYLEGRDIGELAIVSGNALDCRRFSGGHYSQFEQPGAVARFGGRATYC